MSGGGGGMGGSDLRPPSPVICIRAMSCSKARSSQITLAIQRFSSYCTRAVLAR